MPLESLWPYLNCHRPCFFPSVAIDAKGRQRKCYRYPHLMTPYAKLRSPPRAKGYLKPGVRWKDLDRLATAMSDHEAAQRLHQAREELFRSLGRKSKAA